MTTICAFCLSKDRNLSVIDKKYWKIVDSCFTSEDVKLEFLKCLGRLQREHALELCWECSAKLRNWHQFISTSQLCVQVLNAYLEAPTQNLPITVSKLYKTGTQILDTKLKYEETETKDEADNFDVYDETANVDFEETPDVKLENDILNDEVLQNSQPPNDAANERNIKLETPLASDEERNGMHFVELADVFYSNSVTEESLLEELPARLLSEAGQTKASEEKFTSKTKSKGKPLSEPTCMVNIIKPCLCKRCKIEFPSHSALRKHHQRCRTYKCLQCDAIYTKGSGYYSHMKSHARKLKKIEKVKYCETCDYQFKSHVHYNHHIKTNLRHVSRDDYKFQCGHCDLKFPIKRRLRIHIARLHLKKQRYQCEICPKSYMEHNRYQRHRSRQHNLGKDEELNKTCDKCGKTFYSTQHLEDHIRTHTGEKPYKCEFCQSAFAQSGSLYKHCLVSHKKKIIVNKLKVSKGETFEDVGPDKFICDDCGKTFMFKNRLRDHINYVHKGRTDYVCKYCDKMFSSSVGLSLHNKRVLCVKNISTTEDIAPARQNTNRTLKCRACDAIFQHNAALYTHYKLKHLKLKKNDRVRIRNLTKLDKEVVVNGP